MRDLFSTVWEKPATHKLPQFLPSTVRGASRPGEAKAGLCFSVRSSSLHVGSRFLSVPFCDRSVKMFPMSVYFHLDAANAEATRDKVMALTRHDRYKPLPGY